jgi:hypothetical protein
MRKLMSALLAAVVAMTVVVAAAPVAPTDTNGAIRSFLPDATTSPEGSAIVLSDRSDGVDSAAHLTAVAAPAIERVDWLLCPPGADGVDGLIDQDELAQCDFEIGSDSTPNIISSGDPFAPGDDEAYDVTFDGGAVPGLRVGDVLVLGCVGSGRVVSGSSQNCVQELVEDVVLDVAAGASTGQTSAGEIVQLCTAVTLAAHGGPGSGINDLCEVGGAEAESRSDVDARFKPFEHGDAVPNDGFVVRATTDAEVTALNLSIDESGAGIEPGAGPGSDESPAAATDTMACAAVNIGATQTRWECIVPAATLEDNSKLAIWIWGSGAVSTDVTNPIRYDVHYAASVERQPGDPGNSPTPDHVHLVYEGTGDPSDPCHTGDTFRDAAVGERAELLVCTFDETGGTETPATTAEPGGGRLEWAIVPEQGEAEFIGTPPDETGPDGRAVATVELAPIAGTIADIEVRLLDDEGGVSSSAGVQLRGSMHPPPHTLVRFRYRPTKSLFAGRVLSSQPFCERKRKVVVKRVRPGRDAVVSRDRTGRAGRFEVAHGGQAGRYYARAKRRVTQIRLCSGARSRTIRVRR